MFTTRRQISFGLPVIALIVMGAVAGCGGSSTKTVTAGSESTATATTATATPSGDVATEAQVATDCLSGKYAEVKQLESQNGDAGIDAVVFYGPNPVENHVRVYFTPSQ